MDFAMIGDAEASIEDGMLTLRIDLRPPAADRRDPTGPASAPAGPGLIPP